jgi:hypothetical protein
MGSRRIILELDREPQDLQTVWRLDSIARLIQQALIKVFHADCSIATDINEGTWGTGEVAQKREIVSLISNALNHYPLEIWIVASN